MVSRFFWAMGVCAVVAGAGFADGKPFTEEAWEKIAPIYKQIRQHPFNRELADGTLQKSRFVHYTSQDVLYLTRFAKALTLLAAKLEDPTDVKAVLDLARRCLLDEKEAQAKAARRFGLSVDATVGMLPTTESYTNFLLRMAAFGSREELAAALLPCFWIYLELARDLKAVSIENNPYEGWIDTYSSEGYAETVHCMQKLTNKLAEGIVVEMRERMLETFQMAARMEWYFWEAAYKQERWQP
jgi:thiaminase (transcriptional activator TenA)